MNLKISIYRSHLTNFSQKIGQRKHTFSVSIYCSCANIRSLVCVISKSAPIRSQTMSDDVEYVMKI